MKREIVLNSEIYKVGDHICIIEMKGEPQYKNKTGEITCIDDINQLHGTWGGCALVPELDKFKKITKEWSIKY